MKKTVSILLIVAMMLASLLAIIPASAANDTVKINFLPDGVYDKIKAEYEADGATTNDYSLGVAPFVYSDYSVNERIADSKILSITIPVNKTGAVDADGNLIFTLSVYKAEKITTPNDPVAAYKIKIKPADYGLEAGKSAIYKLIKVDLTSYNITVGADEVLTFAATGDTLLPGWCGNNNSDVQKVFRENCEQYVGFACNVGKTGYSSNPNSSIFFDLELEKKAGWDQKEEADASDLNFTYYETRQFMPDEIWDGFKTIYEKDGANTKDWVPSVSPFAPSNITFQNRMAGTRLRSISLPVNKTLGTDSNGDFVFTIHTFKRSGLTGGSPVKSWKIKINAEKYGLTANTSKIYKFINDIDLTSYNIVIAEDEVLAFFSTTDTFLPGYSGGAESYFSTKYPEMMGFGAYAGRPEFTANTWAGSVIFYNLTYDVPISESYARLSALVEEVKGYEKDDFTAGFDAFKTALDAAVAKLEGADSTGDYTAEYTALDTAVKALVAVTTVSKTALDAAITAAKAYESKQSSYTAASWEAFTAAYNTAKAAKDNADIKQSAVNKATADLSAAIAALDEKGDVAALKSKVDAANAGYDRSAYTAVSYKVLTDAVRAAGELISANSESKNAIDAASKAIDDAIAGLVEVADFTELNKLVEQYENASANEYREDSLSALEAAIAAIKEARKPAKAPNVSAAEAAEMYAALMEAIENLLPYAEYTAIDERVAEVKAMDSAKYTADSWAAVTAALEAINDLKSNRYATQKEADALVAELNAAVDALTLVDAGADEGDATDNSANATEPVQDNGGDSNTNTTGTTTAGCGGFIATTAVVMTSVLALGAAVVAKKKED